MRTTVSSRGRIVLPASLRRQDGVEPGQMFEVERLGEGNYRLVRAPESANQGVIDWLVACPEKGFFEAIASEATDEL